MGHRAAIYRVQIRPHRDVSGWRLLGDYDEAGTWLGDSISVVLGQLFQPNSAGTVTARFEGFLSSLGQNQVGASFLSGRSGITSVISRAGQDLVDRLPSDFEDMRTAVLFDLPRARRAGVLVVHVPEGRSIKSIVDRALTQALSSNQYFLEMNPIVPPNALREAVERDAIESVTLVKRVTSQSDRFADAAQWGDGVDRLQLSVTSKRNRRLRRDPLKRFLEDPSKQNRTTLYEFEGLAFDEVAVEVEMPDGAHRTFYVEPRPGGHPMAVGIRVAEGETDRHGAKADVLSRELREVAGRVARQV